MVKNNQKLKRVEDGGPAYPRPQSEEEDGAGGYLKHAAQGGMSLRDWFAGQYIMGIAANPNRDDHFPIDQAATAYDQADAMLIIRTRTNV